MIQAIWHGKVVAQANETEIVEGNHYFAHDAVKWEYFSETPTQTVCPWKGTAGYYSITVDGEVNPDAAWYYPEPKDAAANIKDHVAFWHGVEVITS